MLRRPAIGLCEAVSNSAFQAFEGMDIFASLVKEWWFVKETPTGCTACGEPRVGKPAHVLEGVEQRGECRDAESDRLRRFGRPACERYGRIEWRACRYA